MSSLQNSLRTTCHSFSERNVEISDEKTRLQDAYDALNQRYLSLETENRKLKADLARAVLASKYAAARLPSSHCRVVSISRACVVLCCVCVQ